MYIFINENEILGYNGENLKRYIGDRLVKIIANPTDDDLKEFGYKELETAEMPEEKDGFMIVKKYRDGEKIQEIYEYVEVPEEVEE